MLHRMDREAGNEFTKLSLLEGYINVNDIDIICLSETFLDSSIPIDDNRLSIPGYSMMRVDHPSNTKRCGLCLYYKEHLPIIRRDNISNLINSLNPLISISTGDFNGKCSKWYSFDTSNNSGYHSM